MSKVKSILSTKSCLYCDTLYSKQREDAGCSTCPAGEVAVNAAVHKLLGNNTLSASKKY
jgi:hypothetical protein